MEIHQLRYFVAVTDEGNFSRAAAKVRVAQPSLSQQIRKLEAEIGQRLFDRLPRSVVLTEAGRCFIDYARQILASIGDARRSVDELKDAVRTAIFSQRQNEAQQEAKNQIVDKLVDAHDFPVPEAFVERQIKNRVEQRLRAMAEQGIDPRKLQLDWDKLKESQREKAIREVKASILLGKVSERESIRATRDEVDGEVEKAARQMRKPVAAVHMEFEKDGTLGRIASHIQTDKTLNYLFEHARKTAES